MNAEDAMTNAVVVLSGADSINKARLDMALNEIRHLPVCDSASRVIGMLSNRDVFRAYGRLGLDGSAPVAKIMSREVRSVLRKVPLHAASRMMLEHTIGALPVVSNENELLGIVTSTDVLRVVHRLLRHPKSHLVDTRAGVVTSVGQLMTSSVVSLRASDSVDRAQAEMLIGSFRHLPVVDGENRLIGIVSSRDLDRVLGPEGQGSWVAVAQLIHPVTHTVETDTLASVALDTMLHHKIGALPVVSGDKLVGIVSESDFLARAVTLLRPSTMAS